MAIRITCIKKDAGNHENPHLAITHLGWTNESDGTTGKNTRLEIYNWINQNGYAYVQDSKGNRAKVITFKSNSGIGYVKTEPDSTSANNLLSLPECH
jgi:hypothetical protein